MGDFLGQVPSSAFVVFRMPDPKAVKPDDWDEDAPRQIDDPEDEKPEGWLDNEPEEIDDPGACVTALCHVVSHA